MVGRCALFYGADGTRKFLRISVMAGLEGTSGPEDAAAASAQVNTCISMPISSGSIAGTY